MSRAPARFGPVVVSAALLMAACSADQPVDGAPLTTGTADTSAEPTNSTPATTSTTTTATPTTTTDRPVPAGPVAVAFETGEERNGTTTGGYRAQFAGTAAAQVEGTKTPGFVGSVSALSTWASPPNARRSFSEVIDDQAAWAESDFQLAAAAMFEAMLPSWTLGDLADVDGTEPTYFQINGVGISGTAVPIIWKIDEQTESRLAISVESDFDQGSIHRGYAFTVAGTVRGAFTIDRLNPWDIEGEVVADFEIRDDNGVTSARQWSRAEPVEFVDRSAWDIGAFDVLTPIVTVLSVGEGPTLLEEHQYGGGSWAGTIDVEQTWTRQWGFDDGGDLTFSADIDSQWGPNGQWIGFHKIEGATHGLGSASAELRIDAFALVAAPQEVDRFATLDRDSTEEIVRLLPGITTLVTPPLPEESITVGARWTVAPSNQPDLIIGTFTLAALDNGVATIEVEAPVDTYYGDRYDGWSIEADMTGTVEVDLAFAVALRADLVADGTATFGVGGDRNPATTEPWQQTITIRTTPTSNG